MHAPVVNKKSKKISLNPLQATFNRHRRKIEQLRQKLEVVKSECEQALILCHSVLKPKEKQAGTLVSQVILKINDVTQAPKALTKNERKEYKEFLCDELNLVFSLLPFSDIHEEIHRLHKEVYGKSSKESFQNEIVNLKNMFAEFGLHDVDLSDINPNDSLNDMFEKLGPSMHEKMEHHKQSQQFSSKEKAKSKKELLKEQKARELEALQNKGLSVIYKRLAKELHPDLEQNKEKKAEKEELMKRLTTAYTNQDLFSLLELESKWFGTVENDVEMLSDESLKLYNSLLKEQIETLKQELKMVSLHPRYIEIYNYIERCPEKPLSTVQDFIENCDDIIASYLSRLKDLTGKNPLKLFKQVLAERKASKDHLFHGDLFGNEEFFNELCYVIDNLKRPKRGKHR